MKWFIIDAIAQIAGQGVVQSQLPHKSVTWCSLIAKMRSLRIGWIIRLQGLGPLIQLIKENGEESYYYEEVSNG